MARIKKTKTTRGAKAEREEPKAKERKPRREKKERKPTTRSAVVEADFVEAESTEMPDAVPVALLVFTALFLVGAVVLNLVHLGTSYGVGVFK